MKSRKLLLFAPHLLHPLHNGADIYVERLACYLSKYRKEVILLGANTLTKYAGGKKIFQQQFTNAVRKKTWAVIRTLLFRSHYLSEKFLSIRYRKAAIRLVQDNPDALVVYSFLSTASLRLTEKPSVILTHNDEIAIYARQQETAQNPVQRIVARYSGNWLREFLKRCGSREIFAHVTLADKKAFDGYIWPIRSIVVPIGTELLPNVTRVTRNNKNCLLFCGSLSVQMNLDALQFFRDTFWPPLHDSLQDDIEIWVAGSRPTREVRVLCKSQGWRLYPDVSNERLQSLYARASFAILPFRYTAGAKVKLLNSLAAGLPVLATKNVLTDTDLDFSPNLFSNRPDDWLRHVKDYQGSQEILQRVECQKAVAKYSWGRIAQKMDSDLKDMGM